MAEEARVLVISTGADDPVTAHVLSELVALGVTVEVTPAIVGDLAKLSRARGALAVLRIAPSRRAVTLWVSAASSSGEPALEPTPVEQTLEEPSGAPDDAAASLALRAVELLRARLLKVTPPSTARPSEPPARVGADPPTSTPAPARADTSAPAPAPTQRAPAPVERGRLAADAADQSQKVGRTHDRISVYLGPGALVHPGGGLSAAGAAIGGVRWMPLPRVGGDVLVIAPVVPALVDAASGQVRLTTTAVGLGVWVNFVDEPGRFSAGGGAGIATGFLAFDAEAARSDVRGQDGTIAYALPYARGAITWRAFPPFALRADLIAGVAAPRPVIQLADRAESAIFGRPLLAFGLSAELSIH